MKKTATLVLTAINILVLTACSSVPQLKMEAQHNAVDDSVIAPKFKPGTFKRLMVLAPHGADKSKFDAVLGAFEREFLRSGVTVVSEAVTARALMEKNDKMDVSRLSDAERAMVLAKKSGADAILQIAQWEWTTDAVPMRFFVLDEVQGTKTYREATISEFDGWTGPKMPFPSTELRFVGRLTSVETGEVVASFDLRSGANYNLPSRYIANVEIKDNVPTVMAETFHYSKNQWVPESRKLTEQQLVRAVCNRMMNEPPPAASADASATTTTAGAPATAAAPPSDHAPASVPSDPPAATPGKN